MAQAFVSVKNLAAYCLDYARLISPVLAKSSAKTDMLSNDILDCKPLFGHTSDDKKLDDELNDKTDKNTDKKTAEATEEIVSLPIHLKLAAETIETAEQSELPAEGLKIDIFEAVEKVNEAIEVTAIEQLTLEQTQELTQEQKRVDEEMKRHLAIAQQLEDLNRKYLTASFTKELQLECGFISFKAKQLGKEGEVKDSVTQPLFSIPVKITKKDHDGRRDYTLDISDDTMAINIGFFEKYLPADYYDELFSFVAVSEGEQKTVPPLNATFIDELWAKIIHFLSLVEAEEVSKGLDTDHSIISLKPRSNYFLSQDLIALSKIDEAELEETSLSAWTSETDMSIKRSISDEGKEELFFPFAYDKWQLQVLGIMDNKAAIVEGPPGTGKSQTIANLLCHIAAQGKTVLFVSQKDQAIRGVKDTLKSLQIPSLYGYMPDRNSVLHSEVDEADSAAHSLVAIAKEWQQPESPNPVQQLQQISSTKPRYLESIDQERNLYLLYEQLQNLELYNFDHANISEQWWNDYTAYTAALSKIQKIITGYSAKHAQEAAVYDNHYTPIDDVEEPQTDKYYESLKQAIDIFEKNAYDRSGLKRAIKDLQLKQSIKQVTAKLPQEVFNDVMRIAFSDDSKAARRSQLMALHNYFLYRFERNRYNTYSEKRQELLKTANISAADLGRLEKLVERQSAGPVFAAIEKRRQLQAEINSAETFNANELRSQIKSAQQTYKTNTADYLRNRLRLRLEAVNSHMHSRAILNRIAKSLSKSKRAFKTFDRLKSDPENFNVMSSVVPIWMMSLEDASRILPMQQNIFDYVIVDEASQCNIAYALPVMYRSKHIVFFGDSLQMRDSTTLFKTNEQLNAIAIKHGISEDYQIKASEDSVKSVMDIATLAGFQKTTLQYHYRSPKELIGFSNEYFYKKNGRGLQVINDKCLAYKDTGRVMINHMVQARPDIEISDRTNIAEAYYIKQLIDEMRADEATKDKSIAVLAFFNEQAELIRKVIEDPDIKVSIIEGIQGDERDIIIYSFVIGSTDQKMRYVALTGEGGEVRREANEGRINVAFSRAKLQVHAVTSLQPYLWPEGIWIKRYLEYIDKHGVLSAEHSTEEQQFDSEFEKHVFEYLSQQLPAKDFQLTTQVKSCGFLIDLVIHNKKTGKRLAIECDGPTHFEAGDGQVYVMNDFERQAVLETAGWEFYRIPYHEWTSDKVAAQRDLIGYIDEYFAMKIKLPKKQAAETEAEEVSPLALKVSHVDIPDELVNSLKAAKSATKGRFGR
jgi:KaiC/GvpD/RAD55 family RecA-like ATPase/very-short-patch-repair endonuclease